MIIYLIKENIIKKFFLPLIIQGNYWIKDIDENGEEINLINIEAENNLWYLISNANVYYTENNYKIPKKEIINYSFYPLKSNNTTFYLYSTPLKDQSFKYYDISNLNQVISIGKRKENTINYNLNFIEEEAQIACKNTYLTIQNLNSKMGIYINEIKLRTSQVLKNGDTIFISGLRIIIFIYKDNTYLILNNPNNLVNTSLKEVAQLTFENTFNPEENFQMEGITDKEYFHRKPRFTQVIENYEINIDPPPSAQQENKLPLILTVGPMLTTSLMSVMYGYNAINMLKEDPNNISRAIFPLVMCVSMLAGTILWPTLTKRYNKKKAKEYEALRQKKYGEYIETKKNEIANEMLKQKQILINNNPSLEEAKKTILEHGMALWQRRIEDSDFLNLTLGKGNIPMNIKIKYPEEHFSMVEDNLKDLVIKLGSEEKILVNVPITFSLRENKLLALIGNTIITTEYIKLLLLQIIAYHSYDNLKIIIMTDENKKNYWNSFKTLPHCWNEDMTFRYFATNIDEYKEICYVLDAIYTKRGENKKQSEKTVYNPHYLIISDCIKAIRNFEIIKQLLNDKDSLGFSMIILNEKVSNVPDQCQNFINISTDFGELFKTILNNKSQKFIPSFNYPIEIEKCIEKLSDIKIEYTNEEIGVMPDKVGFLEMYQVGKIEQLNIENRWINSNPMLSLKAPVGIGKSGERISIDLHEKYHGPHGLIAGMTGSGKSEFIITYILSMAINYHPYEVQFILIDYKGGGLAGAFENNMTGIKLPHLVGTITNLDTNEIKRSLSSIESELKRRQKAFNEAREISGESTIDIYKYQRMYREGIVKEPISHLFVISDEFAELKNQEPEFMEQLISTARIGRSLGVHLILATQKPSGVVNAQIWSNTRFRVCLKVQDTSDSNEVIKKPDAAYLTKAGRFYFQVGTNELFTLGQAAWCGTPYIPTDIIKQETDKTINIINNNGISIKTIEEPKKETPVEEKGEELINIVTYLHNLAVKQNIKTKPLWLPKIPAIISIENIKKTYNYYSEKFKITPVIGLYDNPTAQSQGLAQIDITGKGNALIYGMPGSGEDLLLKTITYSLSVEHGPEEVNIYIIDCGTETMGVFRKFPQVGDVAYINNQEKIVNLLKMITEEITKRKKLFMEYNGEYSTYCKNSGNTLPSIIIMISNYDTFKENYESLEDILKTLSRECTKYGIYFIITTSTTNGVRSTIKQNFNNIISLQLNDNTAYSYIFGNIKKLQPSPIYGRGLINLGQIYEFQTGYFCEEDNIINYVNKLSIQLNNIFPNQKAKSIPILPEIVTAEELIDQNSTLKKLPIGIDKSSLNKVEYNFENNINMILTQDEENIPSIYMPIISLLEKFSKLIIIDPKSRITQSENCIYINKNFDTAIDEISNINAQQNKYLCLIIDLDSFLKKITSEKGKNIDKFFELCQKENNPINFIFAGTPDMIKSYEFENWYRKNVNNKEGIWIGNGIADQTVIKADNLYRLGKEKLSNEFAFIIKKNTISLVKLISK